MTALYATARLLWRPAALMLLFPLALVSIMSTVELPNGPVDVADAFRSRTGTPAVTLVLWRFATLVPVAIGVMLSAIVRELQHTAFAWTLPNLSRRLELGKIVTGVLVAAGIAFLATRLTGAQVGLAVFGWSLLTFAIGGVIFDPAVPKLVSRPTLVLAAAVALRPRYILDLAQLAPELLGVLAALASLLLIHREFSRNSSRARALAPTTSGLTYTRRFTQHYWQRHTPAEVRWSTSLSTPSILAWVRAGRLEGLGGLRVRYVASMLVTIVIATILAYITENREMVLVFPWISVGMTSTQIYSRFLYPISRTERASVFFASTIIESLTTAVAGLVGLTLLILVEQGLGGIATPPGSLSPVSILIFFGAWAPVHHWAKTKGPWAEDGSMSATHGLRHFGHLLALISLAMATAIAFQNLAPSPSATWIGGAALLLIIHAVYWLALRHHFRTRDMVVARA